MTIREATIDDVDAIFAMLQASAEEQGSPDALAVTVDDLRVDGFGPAPRFHALIAEEQGTPAGLALYFFNYSTWTSRNGLYLEDLYVYPQYRRMGSARALTAKLVQIAQANNCGRLQWVVYRGNANAIRFYESLGAEELRDTMLMTLKRLS